MTILKPFVMLACVAFFIGFMGYVTVYRMATGAVTAPVDSWSATASAPTNDGWNAGKRI